MSCLFDYEKVLCSYACPSQVQSNQQTEKATFEGRGSGLRRIPKWLVCEAKPASAQFFPIP